MTNVVYTLQGGITKDDNEDLVQLHKDFDLYPDIKLILEKTESYGYDEGGPFWRKGNEWNLAVASSNIRYKTFSYTNSGEMTFDYIIDDLSTEHIIPSEGDRISLCMKPRTQDESSFKRHFKGIVFNRKFKGNKISVTVYDYLRYLKSQLTYTKPEMVGLTASDIFSKVCNDLKLPYKVIHPSYEVIEAKQFDMEPAYDIIMNAINEAIQVSPSHSRRYYMIWHNAESDRLEFVCRNELRTDLVIGDKSLLENYHYETSIDKQTYTRIIAYKDEKTYVSKTGKPLKKGKKTGSRSIFAYPDVSTTSGRQEAKIEGLYGFMPFYYQVGDDWTEAKIQEISKNLFKIFSRPTQQVSLECFGQIGLRAGHLVYVDISKLGDGSRKGWTSVTECEILVSHPLKMNLSISASIYGDYDV